MSSQKQVMAGMDRMAGHSVGKLAKGYRRSVVGPMLARIKRGKSLEGFLRQLGPALVGEMKTDALEKGLAGTVVQSGLIGRTTATPKDKQSSTSNRKETS